MTSAGLSEQEWRSEGRLEAVAPGGDVHYDACKASTFTRASFVGKGKCFLSIQSRKPDSRYLQSTDRSTHGKRCGLAAARLLTCSCITQRRSILREEKCADILVGWYRVLHPCHAMLLRWIPASHEE